MIAHESAQVMTRTPREPCLPEHDIEPMQTGEVIDPIEYL
jgi:hypothetical protein